MRQDTNEEDGCGCGSGCVGAREGHMHGRMGMHMHGRMGMGYGIMDDMDEMGPLHKQKLIEKLKLYKEDLEEQAKFIAKRIDEIQKGSSESEEKDE
jgi:hypothetical protein